LQDDDPFSTARIAKAARHGETLCCGEIADGLSLILTDLEDRTAARAQQTPEISDQSPDQIESVRTSIES